jgi:hypothetical protein
LASATLLAILVAAFAASPAGAASTANCAKQVIADWYDNNRVDRIYPLRCYRQAIKLLPVDVRTYGGAEDDILRALLYAQQGKSDPGDKGNGNGKPNPKPDPDPNPGPGPDPDPGPGPSPIDTSGPSAVPVPLIVLAGIAGLLLVLGAAGYVTRRVAARRSGGGEPPA